MAKPNSSQRISRRQFTLSAGSLLALPLIGCGGGGDEGTLVAQTTSGDFRGVPSGPTVAFKGIPYAQAPVGALRFKSPKPYQPKAGVAEATTFGAASIQTLPPYVQWIYTQAAPQSEDCLTLNVWTPSTSGRLPVLVIFHGGAWRTGSPSMPLFDGQRLAANGCVVVTVSFRVAGLGYLAHPTLADPDTGAQANWQLQDQAAALKWVAQNITAFGGDPGNICLVGQSAGGTTVAILAQSPETRRFVKKVVLLSPAPAATPLANAVAYTEQVAARLGVATPAGLSALPAQTLHDTERVLGASLSPVIDGKTYLSNWQTTPWPAEIPVIIINTASEGYFFVNLYDQLVGSLVTAAPPATPGALQTALATFMQSPTTAASAIAAYTTAAAAEGRSTSPSDIYAEVYGDVILRGPTVKFARALAVAGNNVRYGTFMHAVKAPGTGTPHCAELPFLFGTYGLDFYKPKFGAGPAEDATSQALMGMVTGFARNTDPFLSPGARWGAYTGTGGTTAQIAIGDTATCQMGALPKGAQLSSLGFV